MVNITDICASDKLFTDIFKKKNFVGIGII